jgi:hypothetical protein
MRNADAIEIVHGLSGLAKRQLQVDVESQTQRHDIGVVPGEVQRGSVLRKGCQIHLEEVDVELPVDVVELVSVLLERMLLIDLPEIALIVGALVVDAFVDTETGPVLDRHQRVAAVGALVLHGFSVDASIDEGSTADLAQVLAATAGIVVEVLMRSTADRTGLVLRDRSTAPAADGLQFLAVFMLVVCQEELPVLLEKVDDGRELIDPELLILGRLGIVMDPLIDGYEFTDKLQQKCDLFGLMLNDVKKIEYNVHEQLNPFLYGFCSRNIVPEKGVIALFFAEKA